MIRLQTPYKAFINNQTASEIEQKQIMQYNKLTGLQMSTAITPTTLIIPPNNADLNFSSIRLESMSRTLMNEIASVKIDLPYDFDWRNATSQLSAVFDQGKCGSCWAVSIATALSDNFVTQNVIPINPKISPTYLLSCFTGAEQCGGGNPSLAMKWIQTHGLVTDDILNYSWCFNNLSCSGKSTNTIDLNQLIPMCPQSEGDLRFFMKNVTTPDVIQNDTQILQVIQSIKTILYLRGPVVGGFQVFDNFYSGQFTCINKNPSNIYLENVDYQKGIYDASMTDDSHYKGGHAVVIIGWGSGNVDGSLLGFEAGKMYNIPYWIVRNSWTTQWGIEGYFHMAMYPFNKKSQFDQTVFINAPDPQTNQMQQIPVGGVLFFELSYLGYRPPIIEGYEDGSTISCAKWFVVTFITITLLLFIVLIVLKINDKTKS